MAPVLTPRRVLAARVIAVTVDLAQIALLPAELTPLNNVIDVATAAVLVALVGWHWAFLPSFAVEMVPFVDLVPSWTMAVLFATRGGPAPADAAPKSLPPAGQPPRGPSGS